MKLRLERVESPFVMKVENENGKHIYLDSATEIGGLNKGFRPMELVASGLAGCIAIDIIRILKKQKIDPEVFQIDINASRAETTPSPFQTINLSFKVDESIDKGKLEKNLNLVLDKYCSVAKSLNESIQINCEVK